MDKEALSEIVKLLSGAVGPSTRTAACTALAACSAGEAGAKLRHIIGTTKEGEETIRRLLVLCGDRQCSRVALSALVNISEAAEAVKVMTSAGAVQRAAKALVDDEERELSSLYAGLLSNITRHPCGVDALVGKGLIGVEKDLTIDRLLTLVARLETIPNVLWMPNALTTPEGREALLFKYATSAQNDFNRSGQQPLTWLLRLLPSSNETTRLAVASALRNCAMAEDCHEALLSEPDTIGTCLVRLMSAEHPVPPSNIRRAPQSVQDIALSPNTATPEPLVEIRLLLVEALLLLCKSPQGRKILWEKDAYAVLEVWKQAEDNEQIRTAIDSIIDRVTIAEDNEKPGEESVEPINKTEPSTLAAV
ncbi:Protein Hgh1 [Gracilaria domingensis]|nr:Protein Hgh1 [Gracilaria domingensis]